MCEIKSNGKDRLSPLLNNLEREQLRLQVGLGRRKFWKTSFRSFPLHELDTIDQKANYLVQNPVRAGIVKLPEDYVWSSMKLHELGLMTAEGLVDPDLAIAFYMNHLAG